MSDPYNSFPVFIFVQGTPFSLKTIYLEISLLMTQKVGDLRYVSNNFHHM